MLVLHIYVVKRRFMFELDLFSYLNQDKVVYIQKLANNETNSIIKLSNKCLTLNPNNFIRP